MDKKLNPLDGEIDLLGDTVSDIIRKLNPLTGRLELVYKADSYIQKINPFIGDFDVVGGTGASYITKEVTGNGYINLTNAIANHLMELKAYGGTEQRNLPSGYTEVEYINISENSYLTTDIVTTYDGRVEFDFKTGASILSNAVTYLGVRPASSGNGGLRVAHVSSKVFRMYGYGSYVDSVATVQANTKYNFVRDNQHATLTDGDTVVVDNTFEDTGGNTYPVTINGWNSAGTVAASGEEVNVYKFKARDGQGNLIANYIPCKHNNTAGFYDTVTGNFVGMTDGTATAGPNAAPTPTEPMNIVSNNGIIKFSKNMANVNAQTALIGYYISTTGVVSAEANNRMYQEFIPCKPSTKYTLSMSSAVYFVSISEYSTANDSGFIVRNASGSGAWTQYTITTGANTNYLRFGANIDRSEVTLERVLAINWQLEIGDTPTPYVPYSPTGVYVDGTTETINIHGKNLFDKSTVSTINPTTSRSDFIRVVPGVVYSMSARGASVIIEYDSEQTQLHTLYIGGATYTPSADAVFAKFNVTDTYLDTFQIELGSTATEYEPYYNGGTATAEMLLKVGDYQDVQSIIDGVVTRKVGVKVLDGTEDGWVRYGAGRFAIPLIGSKKQDSQQAPISSHFIGVSGSNVPYTDGRVAVFNGSIAPTSGSLGINYQATPEVADFKQWLSDQYAAGTPIIIVYPLAEETTESVAGQTMNIQAGDNTIEITQASIDNLGLYAKYKATS